MLGLPMSGKAPAAPPLRRALGTTAFLIAGALIGLVFGATLRAILHL
jgi:hypothetical protein